MKHTLLLLLPFVLAYASCKSDDNPNPTPTNLLSGYLTVSRQLDPDSPATKYTEAAYAVFFQHPYQQASDTIHVTVDSVRFNGVNTTFDNTAKVYRIAGALKANNSCYWQVWSGNNIATFAYNVSAPYPEYTYRLPDTIDRSADFRIPLPAGSDSATIAVSANQLLKIGFKDSTGTLTVAQMAGLSSGAATLEVVGYKMVVQAFGGKNFRFTKQTTKTKALWLK